jgi:hypothetical protein
VTQKKMQMKTCPPYLIWVRYWYESRVEYNLYNRIQSLIFDVEIKICYYAREDIQNFKTDNQ